MVYAMCRLQFEWRGLDVGTVAMRSGGDKR
jgi:hypothetical protein